MKLNFNPHTATVTVEKMTDTTLISQFLTTPGMILQHANKYEYLKNEEGATVLRAKNHSNEKSIDALTFEQAKELLKNEKYVLPYTRCNCDDLFKSIAEDIWDAEDNDCFYFCEDGLLDYLNV